MQDRVFRKEDGDNPANGGNLASRSTEPKLPSGRLQAQVLETINPSRPVREATRNSRVGTAESPNQSNGSPRSIDKVHCSDTMADVKPGGPPPAPARKERMTRSGRHARSSSDEIPRVVQGYSPVQPSQGYFYPNVAYSQQQYHTGSPKQQYYVMNPVSVPPPPFPSRRYLEGNELQASGVSSTNQPPTFQKTYSGPQLNRTDRSMRTSRGGTQNHRRSLSSSAAVPGSYGAFWNNEEAPGTPKQQHVRSNSGQFSPRGELLSLTNSFRNFGGDGSPKVSPRNSPYQDRKTWSSMPMIVPQSPYSTTRSRSASYGGGEAVYFAQKKHKAESSRRRHMRQQSAQLFMESVKGTEQPLSCRDIIFLLLFVFHLLFLIVLGNIYGKEAIKTPTHWSETDKVVIYYKNLVYIACLSGFFAIAVSALLFTAMTVFARHFVHVSLFVVITLSFIWGTIGIGLNAKTVVPITGIVALALTVAYTFIVWDRIPFATANLHTALRAIRDFPGVILMAFLFQLLTLAWCIYFAVVCCGIYDAIAYNNIQISREMSTTAYIMLGISFYWTYQVLLNAAQTATAGIVGGWWHNPNDRTIVRRSILKTLFYSMGSVCFGSLFVGPVGFIRQISILIRPSSDEASLMCLHECLHCIQTFVSSFIDFLTAGFNSWAFTYVGLYNYGFLDAGHGATELFEKRGWSTIVTDDLVPNILLIASIAIGGVTGVFAHLVSRMDKLHILTVNAPGIVSFWEGGVIGFALTRVLFGVISSSVNAVIVCFASSPLDFQQNHPELSNEMRNAWREVWPGALDVVDLRLSMASPSSGYKNLRSSGEFVPLL